VPGNYWKQTPEPILMY